jgi:tRNA (guanine26-N2/guanine27-N2)-dimethyltransferase
MYKLIKEGKAIIKISGKEKISKKLPVFYNPIMKFNRDISVLLLNSINKNNLQIALPLAGTGIRGIRFLKELKKGKIKTVFFNDNNKKAIKIIKENLRLNKIKNKIKIHNKDANLFLLESSGFDYIDVDPFGTPNPYLDAAVKRLSRDSILAVTATDTSALCGTYPKACLRKYWAIPSRTEIMHAVGLRILIRKIQLIGMQYEKALTPMFSYSKDHYMRVILKCEKNKSKTNEILKQHKIINNAGPMWSGKLWDNKLVKRMCQLQKKLF